MKYNFDEIIDRKNTNSIKYDFATQRGMPEDILPLWVADMDFRTPPEVTTALAACVNHAIFGYSDVKEDYFNAVRNWFLSGFDYEIKPNWLVKAPGVVYAVAMAVRAFTNKGDAILIQQPVYYPFSEVIITNERKLINNELIYKDGTYHIDFEDFELKIKTNHVKLFILCSPHNPVGRVWTVDELTKMGDICIKYNCLVISDEIHCDFVYNAYKHSVFASLKPEFQDHAITCTAPSKTFNLAGLQISNIFISNNKLRQELKQEIIKSGYSQLNTMGLIACQSAYQHGRDWLNELKEYLTGNLNFLREFLNENLPQIKLVEPQGTYLTWLDFSALCLSEKELDELIVHKAKLWIDKGTMFGESGKGFIRINIATQRSILKMALEKLYEAIINRMD